MINIRDLVYEYGECIFIGIWLIAIFPLNPYVLLYNLNLSFWGIIFLILVAEVDHRRRELKKYRTRLYLPITPKKKGYSITLIAYTIATIVVIGFFTWLVIYA